LIGERAEYEAPVWLDVIVLEKLTSAFEGEISTVDEVFVEAVTLLVDVVDLVAVFAIDDEHYVWECVRCVRVIRD